ncbi:trafficking protein particle complex subunit 2-like protein [Striga asiatica]|uniref:Trafficking protein particle complex subunit 2-like protein n=1 Tax=Striga asiatica TaxID=4170 RepID=A0A5A7P1A0_STRAF|nr:trafficking protein particle complex subunit 2-like protein [Striga asiatica]
MRKIVQFFRKFHAAYVDAVTNPFHIPGKKIIYNIFAERVGSMDLDLIAAVKGLDELSPQQLTQLIRDSGNNIAEVGSHIQVDMEKFARYLPLHLIAAIMAWEMDIQVFCFVEFFCYILCVILLPRIEQVNQKLLLFIICAYTLLFCPISPSVFPYPVLDCMRFHIFNFLLGAYRQGYQNITNDMILLHSAIKLLMVIVSPQYQDVAQVLSAYYKEVCGNGGALVLDARNKKCTYGESKSWMMDQGSITEKRNFLREPYEGEQSRETRQLGHRSLKLTLEPNRRLPGPAQVNMERQK